MSALVSIVMPSYNTGRFIAESIRSVMAQTYTNWELIIVDDCSTDNTMDVVQSVIPAVSSSVILRSEATKDLECIELKEEYEKISCSTC